MRQIEVQHTQIETTFHNSIHKLSVITRNQVTRYDISTQTLHADVKNSHASSSNISTDITCNYNRTHGVTN
jgi:hypothetical protein